MFIYSNISKINIQDTLITMIFTGRPARAIRNKFVDNYLESGPEPVAWPFNTFNLSPSSSVIIFKVVILQVLNLAGTSLQFEGKKLVPNF
jgi:NAD(P)H-dependent flavin oxidoreductase YrpB (nitropropane dioxygenase family)